MLSCFQNPENHENMFPFGTIPCVLFLVLVSITRIDGGKSANCSFSEFEDNVGELMNFKHNRRYPENQAEMKPFCE